MTILYIIANTDIGGAQRNLIQVANEISKKHKVYFMILRKEGELSSQLDKGKIHKLVVNQKSTFDTKSYFKIFDHIKDISPDIIHSQLFFSNNVARLSKILGFFKRAIISGERTNTFSSPWRKEPFYKLSLFIDKFLSKYSDVILTNNKELVNNFDELGYDTSKIKVVYNGIDTNTLEIKHIKDNAKFYICAVGRLEEAKNLFYLLEQFKMLDSERFVLKIVGDGTLKQDLVEYIKTNNMINVAFHGMLDQKQTYKVIEQSHACVLASIYEGLPNTLLEYGLFSKPVIVSNINGNKIVVPNKKYGYIFDLNKKNDLHSKLVELFDNYDLAINKGHNLRGRVLEKFSLHNMVNNIEQIYKEELQKYE